MSVCVVCVQVMVGRVDGVQGGRRKEDSLGSWTPSEAEGKSTEVRS